ncbi:MAG: 23S rRNA (pseudouridine(1915)-N(3))-methyltransferase RlmH [Pseudomonadota bacterium]
MRLHISAVGRLRRGPEKDLVDDYITRFNRTGRPLSLGPAQLVEVEDKKGTGKRGEHILLEKTVPQGAFRCALDERGLAESSPAFAARLAGWRDSGHSTVAFFIGGADGLDPDLRQNADHLMSFGQMVWPHSFVRVMLAEQLYRAATILAGGPYHRA